GGLQLELQDGKPAHGVQADACSRSQVDQPEQQRLGEIQRSSLRSKPLQLQAGRQQGQDCFGQGQLQLAHQDGDLESVQQVEVERHLQGSAQQQHQGCLRQPAVSHQLVLPDRTVNNRLNQGRVQAPEKSGAW